MSKWRFWPFGPGYEGGFWYALSKFALIAVFLLIIVVYLRILFGPRGIFREEPERYVQRDKKKSRKNK
ncbi:MAG: hypothetical protein Q9M37_00760 [Desulfonauticus sp.]|nr:hypothetical protein [Desulfonauticus sp.]